MSITEFSVFSYGYRSDGQCSGGVTVVSH